MILPDITKMVAPSVVDDPAATTPAASGSTTDLGYPQAVVPPAPVTPDTTPDVLSSDLGYSSPQVPSLWQMLDPEHAYVMSQIAGSANSQNNLNSLYAGAYQGKSIDDMDYEHQIQSALDQAKQLANSSAHLPDDQFNVLQQHVADLAAQRNPIPNRPDLQAPNLAQLGLALAGGALNPHYAFDINATPWQAQEKARDVADQRNLMNWQAQQSQQAQDLKANEDLLGVQNTRDITTSQENQQRQIAAANITGSMLNHMAMAGYHKDQIKARAIDALSHAQTASGLQGTVAAIKAQGYWGPDLEAMYPQILESVQDNDKRRKATGQIAAQREFDNGIKNTIVQQGGWHQNNIPDATAKRDAIAKMYGIDPNALTIPAPYETLAKQKSDEVQQRFDTRFNKLSASQKQNLSMAAGRLEVARQNANVMAERAQQGNDILALHRATLAETELRDAQNDYNSKARLALEGSGGKKLDGLNQQYAGLMREQAVEKDPKKLADIQRKIFDIQGQAKYLHDSIQTPMDPINFQQMQPAIPQGTVGQAPQIQWTQGPQGLIGGQGSYAPAVSGAAQSHPLPPNFATLPPATQVAVQSALRWLNAPGQTPQNVAQIKQRLFNRYHIQL